MHNQPFAGPTPQPVVTPAPNTTGDAGGATVTAGGSNQPVAAGTYAPVADNAPNHATAANGTVNNDSTANGTTATGTRRDQPLISFDDDDGTFELLPEFSKALPEK